MKNLTYIWLVVCLLFSGCGMTDVWKDWENEGVMGADRLRPSEVKKILCAADGWKMNYKGSNFYFQFDEGGYVISDTDETILENQVESNYHLDFNNEKAVLLTLDDAGALKYLPEGSEKTFVITAYTEQQITAVGKSGGESMVLTKVTATDIKNNEEAKHAAIIARNKALFLKRIKTDLYNGVIRDASGKFLAHYAISGDNNEHIKLSVLENRVLTHYDRDLTVSANDEYGIFSFDAVTLNGQATTQIFYSFESETMNTDTHFAASPNKEVLGFYTGSSYKTYAISKNNNKGDAKEEIWQEIGWKSVGDIEVNDRDARPLVLCPGPENGIWYIFFDANWTTKDEMDRIYFHKSDGYMPLGGENRIRETEQQLSKFFAAWFHEDGFYMVQETSGGTSFLYFLSPTTDNWLKAQR